MASIYIRRQVSSLVLFVSQTLFIYFQDTKISRSISVIENRAFSPKTTYLSLRPLNSKRDPLQDGSTRYRIPNSSELLLAILTISSQWSTTTFQRSGGWSRLLHTRPSISGPIPTQPTSKPGSETSVWKPLVQHARWSELTGRIGVIMVSLSVPRDEQRRS